MIRLGLIGIGNCGNQVVSLAKETKDIPGIAINTSDKDLENVKNLTVFKIGSSKGAGKSRDKAKAYVKQMMKQLLSQEKFKSHIDENDVVAVVASTGGGTGSGISVMLTHLLSTMYVDKRFILVHVLPSLKESLAAQQNTIEYLKEMNNFNATYMSYDNGCKDGLPSNIMMKQMNEEIVEDLSVIRGDYLLSTPFTSIDEEDLTKILEVPGRLVVHRVYDIKEKDIDKVGIEDMLIQKLTDVTYSTELHNDNRVMKMGVILNVTEKLSNKIDTNFTEFKNQIGNPIEGFEHVAIIEPSMNLKNRAIVISSGLSLPEDRIEKINERIQEILDEIEKQKQVNSILDSIETDKIKGLRGIRNDSNGPDEIDIDDFLSKY